MQISRLMSLLLICFFAKGRPASGQQPVIPAPDAKTIAAFEKLGAAYGWAVRSPLNSKWEFVKGSPKEEKRLPAFRILKFPTKPLPEVSVLFALYLENSDVDDTNLGSLTPLKKMIFLDLSGTKIGDVGLKVLGGQDLTFLYLTKTKVTDGGLKELAAYKNLTILELRSTSITDAGLKELARCKELASLDLGFTKITDKGLKELTRLENLELLAVHGNNVTDAGLKEIASLKKLASLYLNETKITDKGLAELARMQNLKELSIFFTRASEGGLEKLRKALPKCKVQY